MPTFHDSSAITQLLKQLHKNNYVLKHDIKIIIIDDSCGEDTVLVNLQSQYDFKLIVNEINRGHQLSLLAGLDSIANIENQGFILTMDADGEDKVEDVKKMINLFHTHKSKIILARRLSRQRSVFYHFAYKCFLILQKIFLKNVVKTGNFALFSTDLLVQIKDLTRKSKCYSMSFYHLEIPIVFHDCHKDQRISGQSKVGFWGSIKHAILMFKSLRRK